MKGKNILWLFSAIMKYSSELFQGFIFRKACGGREGAKLFKVCHKGTVLFFLFLIFSLEVAKHRR